MNRKKIILISVLVNAGLLLVLFVSAVFFREDASTVKAESQDVPKNLAQDAKQYFAEPYVAPTSSEVTTSGTADQPVAVAVNEKTPTPESGIPIPASAETAGETALVHPLPNVAETVVEEKGAAQAETSIDVAKSTTKEDKENYIEVKVKRGDSLEKIAKAHKTSIHQIKQINHLQTHFLRVGQRLLLPTKKKGAVVAQKETTSPAASQFYVVKCGDNPWTIAMKHNMKVDALLRLNHLSKEKARHLRAGEQLRVR
ncbi:MAG: LysM peptidoglycan-binding domain-containing protein [Chlamydiota bacterium]